MATNNIHQKLQIIQNEIGQLNKNEENKFQKYKYVGEYDILKVLKPLLNEQNLTLTFDDSDEELKTQERETKKEGKEWVVQYRKRAILTNAENPEEQIIFKFWAMGQNTDIAKAKGSAETYAIKYFLMKFFLIPASDNLDPDSNEIEQLYKLYQEKIGDDLTSQKTFFTNFDIAMKKCQISGQTNVDNLKLRMNLLKKEDFNKILNYLERINK